MDLTAKIEHFNYNIERKVFCLETFVQTLFQLVTKMKINKKSLHSKNLICIINST